MNEAGLAPVILLSSVIYAPGCPTAIMYRRETTSRTGGRCAAAWSAGEIRSTTGLTMNLRKAPQTASELKSARLCILGRIIKEQQTPNTARVHERSLWIISNKHHQRRKRPPREPEAYWGWQENGFTFSRDQRPFWLVRSSNVCETTEPGSAMPICIVHRLH